MTKYHINPETGSAGKCKATEEGRGCPFGGAADHYDTMAGARKAYEQKNEGSNLAPVATKQPGVRLQNRAAKYLGVKGYSALPENPSDDDVKNASAYAQVKTAYATASAKEWKQDSKIEFPDNRDDDEFRHLVGTKDYVVATPSGGIVKMQYAASLDVRYDGYWESHPEFYASYQYYANFNDYKENKPAGQEKWMDLDTDSVFRQRSRWGNGDEPSYDKGSSDSAQRAAERALQTLATPTEIGKIAELRHGDNKIPISLKANKSYLENNDPVIRAATVGRANFPKELHEQAINDKSVIVRSKLASRADLSKEHMERLLQDKERDSFSHTQSPRFTLLRNPKIPARMASKVVNEGSAEDLRALGGNRGLTGPVKERLDAKIKQLGIRVW